MNQNSSPVKSSDWIRDAAGHYHFPGPVPPDRLLQLASMILRQRFKPGALIENPKAACNYLQSRIGGYEREVFACLWLSQRHRIIVFEELFYGTINGASIHPREVVKSGLRHNAAALICCHCHPSGDPEPSNADISITKKLVQALALVDIKLLDHVVCSVSASVSLAQRGLIQTNA